jgi:5-oxoprolinase (ATP-hydrolysing)/N-methylhydantoinase A
MTSGNSYRIGFDIGGTFTDFAITNDSTNSLLIHKALTTPTDPARGAMVGIRELVARAGIELRDVAEIVHGTTLVTNALIERKGAKTALLTTKGFRDILEIGYEQRYDVFDLALKYPTPLASRQFRREIDERVTADGQILIEVDLDEVRREVKSLVEAGVKAVAVSFMHSYRNPQNERRVGVLLRKEFPELSVSLSSEVVPEIREYERTSTTTANAFVQPLMEQYLARLETNLAENGFAGKLSLMLSSGGLIDPATARKFPIRLLESGPAGGALTTAMIARGLGLNNVLGFDMGGTTAKAVLVHDGSPRIAASMEVAREHRFSRGSGFPVRAPVVEMIEIGAGGGSIARIDDVGLIKVGPDSAGSLPGPVCYGQGGTQATVTDANLILGYLDAGYFLGGEMMLDRDAGAAALDELGKGLDLDAARTAWGIHSIVSENMAAAARAHVIEQGKDPRDYVMAAFGGAGPAHAADVARIIGIRDVLIPPASGAASAVGFLTAAAAFETVRSLVVTIDDQLDSDGLNAALAALEREALSHLGLNTSSGLVVTRSADMRLSGQIHEISIALPDGELNDQSSAHIIEIFKSVYTKLYHSVPDDAAIEALTWRVRVSEPSGDRDFGAPVQRTKDLQVRKGVRLAFFGDQYLETPVYNRYALTPGTRIEGPAIIEERESTTIVPPDDMVEVDDRLNLRIRVGAALAKVESSRTATDTDLAVDPIGLEIMWARLVNITDECWDVVCRTAFSLIISDAQDFSLATFDAEGEILTQSARAQPVFNLCLPRAIKGLLEKFPAHTLKPGDVLITNDPWLTSGHLFDVAVVTPVFYENKLVGHIGAIGHVTDIGGTLNPEIARQIYEEGLQIPPMKLYRGGQPNEDLFEMIRTNVRDDRQVIGDLQALIGASAVGAARLSEFIEVYQLKDLSSLSTLFHARSEAAMRQAIRAVPDGVYNSEITGLIGNRIETIGVRVEVNHDEIVVDYTAVPAESAAGGFNCTLNYATAHALYPFKCLLTPTVRSNSGCFKPITIRIPERTILNASKPASVSRRQSTGWYLGPNTFAALRSALPDKVRAFTGLPFGVPVYGTSPEGKPFIDHYFAGGGQGASRDRDGKSAMLYPIGSANMSTELFELRTGLLVAERQFAIDSGGAGRRRGGLGQNVRIMRIIEDGYTTQCGVSQYGKHLKVESMEGGKPGGKIALKSISIDAGGIDEMKIASLLTFSKAGSGFQGTIAGGHGFGDPYEREIDLVQRDIDDGYVSPLGAETEYGCVVGKDGLIDRTKTERRRSKPMKQYAS